jgi:Na+/proline symporter
MFSIFLLGMLTRRARPVGVCMGAVAGMAVMAWLIFATDVNFLWPSTFGLIVSLAVGYGWSLLGRPLGKEKLHWTLREQRKLWKRGR